MTTPSILSHHVHVTEREPDGTWEDCTWCSGLEVFRVCFDPTKPATHAEAQALRAASGKGPTGGSNMEDLRRGVKARYGVDLPAPISGFANLWAHLTPGHAAAIQGSMSAFGPLNPLSKYDRNFDGAHATFVARVDSTDRVWWCDPEAPTGVGYEGVFITKAQLEKFVTAFGGQHIVAPILVTQKEVMYPIVRYLPGYKGTIKPSSNIRTEPKITATKVRMTASPETQVLIGTVNGDKDPANGSTEWFMWYANGHYEFTAKDNVPVVTPPVTVVDDGFTKATQDAAVAAQKAADTAVALSLVKQAVDAERKRLSDLLGI